MASDNVQVINSKRTFFVFLMRPKPMKLRRQAADRSLGTIRWSHGEDRRFESSRLFVPWPVVRMESEAEIAVI
jgi:hypothetical protein